MTSTSFNVGIGDGSRLSSRVLRPPGGGHTDIFSGEPEPPRGRRLVPAASGAMFGHGDDTKSIIGAQTPTQNGASETSEPAPQPEVPQPAAPQPAQFEPVVVAEPAVVAEPVVASPAKASNPATPAVTPTEQTKAEPPKRVRVPPGGFSSGLW
ncbi:proline-rich receptor-like protein kinase PERK9 [Pieris rapae]|uniref:proline-rich receptor-like protein kinase PERK9 n=1 Tax=Pieris rapae TaxID=64459 RepID=UPI000B92B5DF|nr:proline-rich receptor-like protein kinase PERK9 [Pieris rapae]